MTPELLLSDAHAHLSADGAAHELVSRLERNILTCYSTGTPAEWERVRRSLMELNSEDGASSFLVSFGIHPWDAASHEPYELEEAYEQCAAIGEIGIDTVWCNVPLARQSTIFEAQLQLAVDLHKPIVLHTKGAEGRIADMVAGFPEPMLVHWYSGPLEPLERFAEQRCYFTLGPDCSMEDELSRAMLTSLPLDRLLVETDGIEGVRWAIEETPHLAEQIAGFSEEGRSLIEAALRANVHTLALARGIVPYETALALRKNMERFYGLR